MIIGIDVLQNTPLGRIWLAGQAQGLVAVAYDGDEAAFRDYVGRLTTGAIVNEPGLVAEAAQQLAAYLAGERQRFNLTIDWSVMSPFQRQAMRLVAAIPFGQVRTYGDIAVELGRPGAARAVGRANATNPLPIIVPCHRVLGADGRLHGYGGGLERKAWLLRREGSWLI